jgi:hypothetical protein
MFDMKHKTGSHVSWILSAISSGNGKTHCKNNVVKNIKYQVSYTEN